MADLLALQPNLTIRTYIVAPVERRESVFSQINRPVFADINGRKLSEVCCYLTYDSIDEIASEKNLKNMKATIVDEYAEFPEISES
jgi:hypothetical protein